MKKRSIILLSAMIILTAASCSNGTTSPPNSKILVSSIQIGSEKGRFEITASGGSLQLFSQIEPDNADDKSIKWSIEAGSEYGQISDEGLVTAISNGTV